MTVVEDAPARNRYPFAFRALRSRNFRLYFSGQIVSQCGSWMTTATNAWLIYHLTGDKVLLGWSAVCGQVPSLLLGPLTGVLVDRWDLRRTLIVTQILAMVESIALATMCWFHFASWQLILSLQLFQGLINAFDLPARQSFGVQMVDRREDLQNAIALNSTMVNASRLVGPALAGLMIKFGGEGLVGAAWSYTLDVISYIGVIAALYLIVPNAIDRTHRLGGGFRSEFFEGLRYVARFPALRTALLLMCVSSFFGVSFNPQMAAYAADILHVGPDGYGYLTAGIGAGALVSALYLATRRSTYGIPVLISHASMMFGLTLIALSFTHHFTLAMLLTPVFGAAMVLQSAGTNTLLQTLAADDKRGRVMAFFTMSFMGMVPLGALAVGYIAHHVGLAVATRAFGGIVMAASLLARPTLLRIAREMRPLDAARPPAEAVKVSETAVASIDESVKAN